MARGRQSSMYAAAVAGKLLQAYLINFLCKVFNGKIAGKVFKMDGTLAPPEHGQIYHYLGHIATIRGRVKQGCLTWSGITIGKLQLHHPHTPQPHHHHMSLYN